jgi:hypothetical protein
MPRTAASTYVPAEITKVLIQTREGPSDHVLLF